MWFLLKKMRIASWMQWFAFLASISTLVALWFLFQKKTFIDPSGLDISGAWEFHNGPLSLKEAQILKNWGTIINVPRPLPETIRSQLKSEFWYRKNIIVPKNLSRSGDALLLSLGSIKGEHEVYWNGFFLGAGGRSTLALYRIPEIFYAQAEAQILVRVKKSKTIFPGIVQLNPVLIGRAQYLDRQLANYYFDVGVKPLLPAALKLILFFLFLTFHLSMPAKREYAPFALFSILSSCETAAHSIFSPFSEDYFFKSELFFFFSVLSLATIPFLTVNFLRLSEKLRSAGRLYGMSLGIVFIGASLLLSGDEKKIVLYQLSNKWLPLFSIMPSAVLSIFYAWDLFYRKKIKHRAMQIFIYSIFLLLGAAAWSNGSSSLFKFKIYYPELLDILIFSGLTFCMLADLHFLSLQSEKMNQLVPKWFSFLLSTRTEHAVFEVPMLVMAVDTAEYTKKLSKLSDRTEKNTYHAKIREALHTVISKYSAQKISERGDGALFAWEYSSQDNLRKSAIELSISAAQHLMNFSRENPEVEFRIGLSCGSVRCEWRSGELSFLGEALNEASRLESIANSKGALVHESLVKNLDKLGCLREGWISADLKGVTYRARTLLRVA